MKDIWNDVIKPISIGLGFIALVVVILVLGAVTR